MKKYLLTLITLTFFLCEASFTGGGMAFAATNFGTGLQWEYNSSSKTLTISVRNGYTTGTMPYWNNTSSSPLYYTNRPWESSKTTITTVIINKGVKNIGSYAFYGCTVLATVKFGTSATDTCSIDSVGTYAFYNCAKVATVYCYGSTSTYAMRNWLNIGFNGSYANPYSTSTVKGSSKKFYMNSSSTTTLTTSNLSKATKIKPYAFYKHSQLTSVTLPSTVKSIGNYAFAYDSLLNTVKFGSGSTDQCGIDTIMGSAFATCVALATVYCYGGIEKWLHIGFNAGGSNPLGAYAGSGTKKFYLDGTSITTLTIPEGITKIKGYAFYKHTQFTKISLPSTVSYVGAYALAYCTGLTDLVALPTTPPNTESSTFNSITPANINLYVASAASATYGSATRWSAFTKKYTTFEGECGDSGDNITFVLNFAEHSLTLTGSGAMATYGYSSPRAPWYTFKDDINTIIIGSGITGIGAYAFKDCANVTSASLPTSITSIGSSAFDGCKAMTSYSYAGTIAQWLGITFSGSSSNPMYYVKKCFVNGSTEVKDLVIPNGVTTIGQYAFYQCSGLTAVTLPASLKSVGSSAFSTCTNIASVNYLGTINDWCWISFASNVCNPAFFSKQLSIEGVEQTDIYLADSLTKINDYAFYDNRALETISIKNKTTINSNALTDCPADIIIRGELTGTCGTDVNWSLDNGVLTISGTGAMTSYSLSSNVPWYGIRTAINKLIVEEGITTVGKYALQNTTNLTGAYLPSTITSVEDYVFNGCTSLEYIVSAATTPPTIPAHQEGGQYNYASGTFASVPTSALIYVPNGTESAYSTASTDPSSASSTGWRRFETFVPSVVFSGTCGATGHESEVTWVYDPEDRSLTISGTGAMADFANNTTARPWNGLKTIISSLVVENGVTTIGKYAFYGCTAITSLNSLPNSLTSIGYQAFYGCTSLTSVTIPQNVTKVGDGLFNTCSSLTTVVWNAENCTRCFGFSSEQPLSTSYNPFYCTGSYPRSIITSFTFGENVKTIPAGLCYNMTNLTSVTIPASVETIDNDAFKATGLTSITIPNTVTSLGTSVFQNCTALESVTLPSGLTAIGNSLFSGCTALASIQIPASVASLGTNAFQNCTGLTEIYSLNAEVPTTQSNTFSGLTNTPIKVYVPTFGAMALYKADTYWPAEMRTIIGLGGYCGAEGNEENVIATFNPDNGTLTISGTGAMADYNTTDNRAPWYDLRSEITKLVIEEGVTTIGASAFYAAYNFEVISLPASLKESKTASFATIVEASLDRVNYAGTLAQWCDVKLGALSSTPMNYGTPDFYVNGSQISGTVTIPEGVDSIKSYTLINLGITNLYLPTTLEYIGSSAFDKNTALSSMYYAGSAADWCGVSVASSTSHPLYVARSNNPQLYCDNAKPTSVVVPDGITTISDYHFYNCQNLTSVTISKDVTSIGAHTFDNSALTTIVWNATNCPNFTSYTYAPFYNIRTQITSVSFGSNVENIPGNLCYGMNNASLMSISIPNSVTSIGNYVFKNCSNLTTVNIGEESSLTTLGNNVFENCAKLTAIYIPNGLTALPKETFSGCSKLASVTYGDAPTLATIGYSAFKNCSTLTSITIPESVTTITGNNGTTPYTPFSGCENLTTVIWNARNCGGWTPIHYMSSTYYQMPFEGIKTQITSFTFGSNVQSIPTYVCHGMTGLSEITIPASVTSIGANAFNDCSSTMSVTCEGTTPPTLASGAFSSPSTKKLYLPHDVAAKAAYRAASGWSSFTEANTFPKIVQFSLNGKSGDAIDPQYFDNLTSKASVPSDDPSADYYTFGGWYENAEGTGSAFAFSTTNITADKILYAKWTEDLHSVTVAYKCGETTIQASGSVSNVGVATAQDATAPEITGYTFSTWSAMPSGVTTSDELTSATISINATADDKTITANYTINQYTVSFDSDGGSEVSSITQDYNSAVSAPTDPTRDGYTFNGWIPAVPSVMPAENTECMAQWTINQYTVSFDSNGGSEVSSIKQNYNTEIIAPANPTKTGYTFAGWSPAVPSVMPAGNTECVAQWTINSYDVTFDLQGHGSSIAVQSVNYNGLVSKPSDPEADYYTFGGWYKEAGCTNAWDFSEDRVTSATTLYAKWTLNGLALDENNNNNSLIAAYNGQTTNVTMTRSLTNAQYNTFCLPFSLSADQMAEAFGASYDLEELTGVTYDGESLALEFTQREALVAGKPYLLQPANNAVNPSFTSVTIDASSPSDGLNNAYIEYRGVYSPASLEGGNHNLLFLGAGNELFWPASNGNLKGFRAYFIVKSPALGAMRARIVKKEDTATGIDCIQPSAVSSQKYIKDGILYIERDGKTFNAQGQRIK